MSRELLWVVTKSPAPEVDGSRVATIQLIEALSAYGFEVDLAILAASDEKVDFEKVRERLLLRDIYVLRRPGSFFSSAGKDRMRLLLLSLLNPLKPVTVLPFVSAGVCRGLRAITEGRVELLGGQEVSLRAANPPKWDSIILEGVHAGAPFLFQKNLRRFLAKIPSIYRAQNFEAALWKTKRKRTRSWFKKLLLWWQEKQMLVVEKELVSSVDAVAAVSETDGAAFLSQMGAAKVGVVPVGLLFEEPLPAPRDSVLRLLFLGKLDWYPNADGLQWFLREVWPKVRSERRDIELIVAGSGDSSKVDKMVRSEGVHFRGRVSEVEGVYRESDLTIAPVFFGSGMRVKAVEAASFGRATLSTALGLEGTNPLAEKTCWIEESSEDWVKAILAMTKEEAALRGQAAFDHLQSDFSQNAAAATFIRLLRELPLKKNKEEEH